MNPKPAQPVIDTHVLLRDGDKLLFSQRGGPYGYGRWHLPSGKLDQGATVSAGAARELLEEGLLGYLEGTGALAAHGW